MLLDDPDFEQRLQQLKPGDRFAIVQAGPDWDIWVKSGYRVLEVSQAECRVMGNLEQRFSWREEGDEQEVTRKHFIYLWPNEPLPMMLRWILDAVTAYQPGG